MQFSINDNHNERPRSKRTSQFIERSTFCKDLFFDKICKEQFDSKDQSKILNILNKWQLNDKVRLGAKLYFYDSDLQVCKKIDDIMNLFHNTPSLIGKSDLFHALNSIQLRDIQTVLQCTGKIGNIPSMRPAIRKFVKSCKQNVNNQSFNNYFEEINNNKCHDILCVKQVPCSCPIKEIRGTKGAFAKQDISKNVTIGHYLGIMWSKKNYYEHGNCDKQDYAISVKVGRETFIIEPQSNEMLLQYINDGRNGSKKNLNNCEFIQQNINGVPMVAVITTTLIKKNKQLYIDYGNTFWTSRK